MCGIFLTTDPDQWQSFGLLSNLAPRGPDSTSWKRFSLGKDTLTIGFTRLAITGRSNGEQPFYKDSVYLVCNGEIYNHSTFQGTRQTQSDCEVLLHLYLAGNRTCSLFSKLEGEYAFILCDLITGKIWFGRDCFGVRPLFISSWSEKYLTLASEGKAVGRKFVQVTPGKYYSVTLSSGYQQCVLEDPRRSQALSMPPQEVEGNIEELLTEAVRVRLPQEVEVGFLLSGGFDSSLILSIACRLLGKSRRIQAFSCGFASDAPDLKAAKEMVTFLEGQGYRIHHHSVVFTLEEGLSAVPAVVSCLESYDTTTVRASVPMFLLARYISENTNVKVILSGEGSDEINGSYLYFLAQKDPQQLMMERKRLTGDIHFFDGLRADRTLAHWGLELRVPFLDPKVAGFLLNCSSVDAEMLDTGTEKQYIRERFSDDYLPPSILWRVKAAFSDAVSGEWRRRLLSQSEHEVSKLTQLFPDRINSALPPEDQWYQSLYRAEFGNNVPIPYLWRPKWVGPVTDPSATVLTVHALRNGV